MAIPALTAADTVLEMGIRDSVPLTPMKLQKLLYFSHGWYLGLSGEPLLAERLQAWKFGPVLPSVYHEFKDFGNQPIGAFSRFYTPQASGSPEVLAAKPLFERIWSVYAKYSAAQLSALSHEPRGPWHQVVGNTQAGSRLNVEIPNEIIREFFAQRCRHEEAYG